MRRRPRSTRRSSLREVGHGLFPALLADEGSAALAALTEESQVEIDLDGLPEARFDAFVEAAGISSLPRRSGAPRRTPPTRRRLQNG